MQLGQQHADSLFQLVDNNRQYLLEYHPVTVNSITDVEAASAFIDVKLSELADKKSFWFVVTTNDNLVIGCVFLFNIDWRLPKGELVYFIDEAYQGQGIIFRSIKWLVEYSFKELAIEKLLIRINPANIKSQKVALKNGFIKEALLKRDWRNGFGEITDTEYYGLWRTSE